MSSADSRSGSGPLPELEAVTRALVSVFGEPVTILERAPHEFASSFPGEILRCRTRSADRTVLCKYEGGRRFPSFGHRGGPGYEATVYREVVRRLRLPALTFHGAYADAETGGTWLFLEYVAGAVRLGDEPRPRPALRAAARWAGQFHRLDTPRLADGPPPRLKIYNGDYYARWAQRASDIADVGHRPPSWLRTLCERAEPVLRSMADLPSSMIHGEFTPKNLLIAGEDVIPVDWESAAVGVGAVDLAALIDNWPREVAHECEREYLRARWPDGPPADHPWILDLARLYWDLRWLGDRRELLARPRTIGRYESLHATGQRLGLV